MTSGSNGSDFDSVIGRREGIHVMPEWSRPNYQVAACCASRLVVWELSAVLQTGRQDCPVRKFFAILHAAARWFARGTAQEIFRSSWRVGGAGRIFLWR